MKSYRSGKTARKQREYDHKNKQCSGKREHNSEESAMDEINSIRAAGKSRETPAWVLHAYLCPKCDFYHVGHYMPLPDGIL